MLRVAEPEAGPGRLHLGLANDSADAQPATVDRLSAAGARHTGIGQGDVPWVMLTAPEGNKFRVLPLSPR